MNVQNNNPSDGWPADGHPIFIDAGFGRVQPSKPVVDGFGEYRRLTPGAVVPADADRTEFAQSWAEVLSERPTDVARWEYSVDEGRPDDMMLMPTPLPLEQAFERVRTTPGARLQRRAVGDWRVVKTPFPELAKAGWAEIESEKRAWHGAMMEFPPSYRGVISRQGGVEHTPSDWIEFARRAAAVGFTPQGYRMLGTAHLAWEARQLKTTQGRKGYLPKLSSIEMWARFPALIDDGLSPLQAIDHIVWGR